MKITMKKAFTILLIAFLLGFSFGYIEGQPEPVFGHRPPRASANVYVFVETAEGKAQIASGNVITNIGEQYVRNILGFENITEYNATQWITVSNDASPVATWTKLANEKTADGFTRAANDSCVAWQNGGDYAYNVTKKFTATSDSVELQCAGLQWSGQSNTDNNLFAAAAFTQTTFNTNDNCTIVWVITINAN